MNTAMPTPAPTEIERLVKGIGIPPRPEVLTRLQKEIDSPNMSLSVVGQIINGDVALAASVMKVANSPAFGLSRKVSTVQQAIPVLGSRVLSSLVAGFALRSSINGPVRLDRFWDSSIRVAQLAARLTKEFRGVAADHAYTFGLFHDCGIAVLLQRFPDYRDTLQLANADGDRSFTEVEEARHATHHAAIGCFLTRSWGLAEDISRATLIHHDLSIFAPDAETEDARCRSLISLAALSDCFVNAFMRMSEDASWLRIRPHVMQHLNVDESDFHDLREMAFDLLENV